MILQNKPTTLSINTPQTVTLNVSELSSSINGTVSAYESNSANWKVVEFIYKNDTQIKRLIFRLNKSLEDYSLTFNEYSLLGNFECVKIRIEDYQADSVIIKRDQFASLFGSTALFDIEVTDQVIVNPAPTILSIVPPLNGDYSYFSNSQMFFQVDFSEAVEVGVAVRLLLNVGGQLREAVPMSGSMSSSIVFRYIVQSVQEYDLDGISIVGFASNPPGSSDYYIKSVATSANANLTLPIVDTSGVLVNSLTPNLNQITSNRDGENLSTGDVIIFTVWYDYPIETTGSNIRLVLEVGSTTRYTSPLLSSDLFTGSFSYTVLAEDLDTNGIRVMSMDLNGGSVTSIAGIPANNTFTPVTTSVTIGTSSGFNVNEVPGFTEVIESLEVLENPTSTSVLYVFGIHESSPYRRLYRIDSSLNVTNPFNIKNTSNESMAFLQYRSSLVINSNGWNDVIFRARNVSDQRKLFRWNPLAATLTQISNTNPSGEDLPEAITNFIYSDIGETNVDQAIYFSSVNSSGFTKLHMYNVSTGSVTQISNTNPTGNDNPHDMVRFTESTGEEFLYFISTEAVYSGVEYRRLYKVNINGIVTQVNLPIDTPYAKGNYNYLTDNPYPPYDTFTNYFRSKSIAKYENSLFIYASSSALEVGGSYLKLNNSGTFTTVYEGQLQLESIITEGYFRGYNSTTGQWKLYKIPNSGLAVEVSGVTNPAPWSIAGSNLYAAGILDLFNSYELLKIDTTTQIITRATTTIPVRPANFENGGTYFSKYGGYIYFSGSIATRDPGYTSLYRTTQGSISTEEVFNYHTDILFEEDLGDATKYIVTAAGKLFFTIVNQMDATTRLLYITQT